MIGLGISEIVLLVALLGSGPAALPITGGACWLLLSMLAAGG